MLPTIPNQNLYNTVFKLQHVNMYVHTAWAEKKIKIIYGHLARVYSGYVLKHIYARTLAVNN